MDTYVISMTEIPQIISDMSVAFAIEILIESIQL